jgi:hypothetical protein
MYYFNQTHWLIYSTSTFHHNWMGGCTCFITVRLAPTCAQQGHCIIVENMNWVVNSHWVIRRTTSISFGHLWMCCWCIAWFIPKLTIQSAYRSAALISVLWSHTRNFRYHSAGYVRNARCSRSPQVIRRICSISLSLTKHSSQAPDNSTSMG